MEVITEVPTENESLEKEEEEEKENESEIVTSNKSIRAVLPPGKYYFGDPYHALDDFTYNRVFNHLYSPGLLTDSTTNLQYVVQPIMDGYHRGTDRHVYHIESTSLGLLPVGLCKSDLSDIEGCRIFESSSSIIVNAQRGLFTIMSEDVAIAIHAGWNECFETYTDSDSEEDPDDELNHEELKHKNTNKNTKDDYMSEEEEDYMSEEDPDYNLYESDCDDYDREYDY